MPWPMFKCIDHIYLLSKHSWGYAERRQPGGTFRSYSAIVEMIGKLLSTHAILKKLEGRIG